MTPLDPFLRMVLGRATMAMELLLLLDDGKSLRACLDDKEDLMLVVVEVMDFFFSDGGGASINNLVLFLEDLTISSWTMTKKLVRCL